MVIFGSFASSIVFTIMILSTGKERVNESAIWSFLTTYLLYTSLIFLIIVFSEIIEFFEFFNYKMFSPEFNQMLYLYLVLPLSILMHLYGIYRLSSLFEFSFELIDLKVAGLPLIYSAVSWVTAVEITEYKFISIVVVSLSEIAYAISLPILIVIIYFTLKEKQYEEAIIQSPIGSVDRIAGISMSFVIFSLAVLMRVYHHMGSYDILEAFALLMFVVSGELYRRTIFSLRKIF